MALIRKQAEQQGRAGNSIGERREIQRDLKAQVAPQRAAAPKPLDKFAGVSNAKSKKGLAGFAPNALYQQARRFNAKDTPYKRAIHAQFENGAIPQASKNASAKPPSDPAILKFLNRVIEQAPKAGVARRSAVASKGQPVQRAHRKPIANPQAQNKKA